MGAGMPATKSRKDSDGGWSKGAQSSKGNTGKTGNTGTKTKANIDADADSESERPSASGIQQYPGPPIDDADDHDKQEADATAKEYEVDLEPDQ